MQLTARSNGLAEAKNGAVVRKLFGYEHIPQRHATRFNTFCRDYLNPFLNFHRPSLFATDMADPNKPGRIKRVYRPNDAMTPLDSCQPAGAANFLRPASRSKSSTQLATALTDVQAAEELNEARPALFRRSPHEPVELPLRGAVAARAVDMWTMRWRAPARSVDNARHCPPPAPSPTCPQPSTTVEEPPNPDPHTLHRSTTDRLASRRRSQTAPGSYLNWKRLSRST